MRDIEAACVALTLSFFRALDTRQHEAAAALIAVDGVWNRLGKRIEGRRAILSALEQRPEDRTTCHLVTNLSVVIVGQDRARVHYYLTAFEGALSDGETPAAHLVGVRYGTDEMVRLRDGWCIMEKRSEAVMRGG